MIQLESKFLQILSLLTLALIFGLIFTVIGLAFTSMIWEVPFTEVTSLMNISGEDTNINPLKFLQLFNSLGLFVIPGIVFTLLFMKNKSNELRIDITGPFFNYGLVILLFFTLIPIINYSVKINEALQLPEFLSGLEQWMKSSEENAKELTMAFLKMENPGDFILNVFLIALIPAVGEELIFRGLIQKIINKNKKNYHIGIWVSAIIFSAIHFQFYGFVPRMLLGAFFGYLLVWSGSLWLPIFAHFLNNATGVIGAYIYGYDNLENDIDQIGSAEGTEYFTLISLVVFSFLLFRFKKAQKNPAQGGISI